MSTKLKAPKGTRDLAGAEMSAVIRLESVARAVFRRYGFSEIRTPLFEHTELFSRSLGATSDVVEKEMFTFTDRGERMFALRPEGTAGVVRHFIEQNLNVQGAVHRLYYMGPMFRAERPQAGRYRQFWQIGSEHFGQSEPSVDADTVRAAADILRGVGVGFVVQINSLGCGACRPLYRKALSDYLHSKRSELTEESVKRMAVNPLRVLDSKADGPKLGDAPVMKTYLCPECRVHDEKFRSFLGSAVSVEENPRLVRGLDYYSRTVFEFVSDRLGAQNALAAGGRYDELVHLLGGPPTPAVGFALGVDRVVSLMAGEEKRPQNFAVVISLAEPADEEAFQLAEAVRSAGWIVPPVFSHKKKMKNQLAAAADSGARYALLLGEDELAKRTVSIKNLETRDQKQVDISAAVAYLQRESGLFHSAPAQER